MEKIDKSISEKLSEIQSKIKANKSRTNNFGKYNYRSAEDIIEALKQFNEPLGVFVTINEEVTEMLGLPIIKSTAMIVDVITNATIQATAVVAVDLNSKGMQKPQQFGAASSYAKKYALGNLLLIDDTQDADATNNHGKNDNSSIVVNGYKTKIKNCKDIDSLEKIGPSIKASGLETIHINMLRELYAIKSEELNKV